MERNSNHNIKGRVGGGGGGGGGDGLSLRSAGNSNHIETTIRSPTTTSSDFVLQWGNRKRSRCMKFQVKDRDNPHHHNNYSNNNQDPTNPSGSGSQDHQPSPPPIQRSTGRVDRRSDRIRDSAGQPSYNSSNHNNNSENGVNNGYLNLRQRSASPSPRILRNSESSLAMRGQSNGVRGLASPDRGGDRKGNNGGHCHGNKNTNNNGNVNNNVNGGSASSDSKKGGGTSSGSDAIPAVWPPKFAIALTTKEKEEDFMAIKGSKLPQRPKKRAKFIQRTLNLVSPGSWLCDLTLERYEVREKKVSKKRPRGLRAMGNMDSDSE